MKTKTSRIWLLTALMISSFCTQARGAEITAIDFNGDLLGKVISDGKVVSYDNELLGNVTADSLIVDFNGKLVGGVVPQGIAIGTDNRILGKVNSDGSVRQASGRIIGKALPNGLVVDDYFKIIGGVLFPGLVYSDKGETIGRLTGNGQYTDIEGRKKGFVTPDGYAYSLSGGEAVLEGRLISNKMVVSPEGKFIGSVVPGGEIRDLEGEQIGKIHANGLAYDEESKIIGQLVRNGYAFDDLGQYIGLVTYNGEIINNGNVIGHQGMNNEALNAEGQVIGHILDISATISNSKGEYVGRLMPEGKIAQARETIGEVGPNAIVRNTEKQEIGKIIQTGSVFDYQGKIRGQNTFSGETVSVEGSPLGYAYGNLSFETSGRMLGKILPQSVAIDLNNQPLGIAGINGEIEKGEKRYQVSPLGYVFSSDGQLNGHLLNNSAVYSLNGQESARLSADGSLQTNGTDSGGKITQSGIALRENGAVIGGQILATKVFNFLKEALGNIAGDNLVVNNQNKILGKILPDMSVAKAENANDAQLMPKIGGGIAGDLVLNFRGEHLGYVQDNGEIKDLGGAAIGKVGAAGTAIDNNGILVGGIMNYKTVIDAKCQPLGYINSIGDVRNNRGVKLGKIMLNNQVFDEGGSYIGYGVDMGLVMGENGILGTISADGKVLSADNKMLGCITAQGRLYGQDGKLLGKKIAQYPVMNFNSKLIGQTILNNQVANDNNQLIGQAYADENVKSGTNAVIGRLFKYRYAFDNTNRYMGEIAADGNVYDNTGKAIATVTWDGFVKDSTGANTGYALYDMYIYDENNKSVGNISTDGIIRNPEGGRIGKIDKGFMVDLGGTVLARGNRDYYILSDKNNEVLGELLFNGNLVNLSGATIGKLGEDGGIYNDSGEEIGRANSLQYYNVTQDREKIYDSEGNVVGYVAGEGNVYDENGKLIGKLGADGTVRGADGSIIGGKGQDWYARQPQEQVTKDLPKVGVYEKTQEDVPYTGDQYRKSLNIALTPDGEYLGDILEDGRVVDKDGNYLGRRTPDGLIMDDDGTLIGIEEVKRPEGEEMFVPAGTFGDGGAYGVGNVGSNLGPGGGFGPGERYDPRRAAALAAAQNVRRQNMAVGHIASSIKPETFDGYQQNWDAEGISKAISSWRVDMSEMILADKPIPAVIARSIDSNNPTPVTAYVERNVYAEEGRNVIIPAGSRLMGTLNSMVATTEDTSSSARVQITWERLIRPDGVLFTFQGITADAMGRGGALGYLDQQLFKKYTLPIMTTALTSYTSYLMATNEDSSGEVETSKQQAANDARENFLSQMNEVFSEILADKSNIKPLTYVPAGTRIIVFPNVDLWMRTADRDAANTDLNRTDLLIDDKKVQDEINEKKTAGQTTTSTSGGNTQTVYGSGNNETTPSSPKLIDDSKVKNNNNNINGAVPPPPPPSSSVTPAVSTTNRPSTGTSAETSKQSEAGTGSDDSVPQLF